MKFSLKGLKPPSGSKGLKDWYTKEKAKRAAQRALVPSTLRILTFALTLASMGLGLSFLPLFPQPLPIVIAFLIAFVAYENPGFSLPVGGALIGLGLIFNMTKVNFISVLGDQFVRQAVIFAFLFVFTILPIVFHKHKAAIAIDLGIVAAVLLFNGSLYFLAIPLIFASIALLKKLSALTAMYYGLISTPLLMMQYLGFIIEAADIQWDWWVLPNSSPPIFAPLTGILQTVQDSMSQFRLFDTSQVVYAITDQVTQAPPLADHTIIEVLSHYLDSIPGIVLFLVIVAVSVSAFLLTMRFALRTMHVSEGILPPITAAMGTLIVFICLSALQGPLAFEAKIDGGKIAIGTIAAALFALPALFVDQTPKRRGTVGTIAQKARELLDVLGGLENTLKEVEDALPVNMSSIRNRALIVKDRLNHILSKASNEDFEPSEIDEKFNDLESIGKEIVNLTAELDLSLKAYHVLVKGEYSTWIGKFQDIGLQVSRVEKKDIQQALPVEERIVRIKETINAGERLVEDVLRIAEQVYRLVRALYNPALPQESQVIAFARRQLLENTDPWIASSSLFTALNNWRKQYLAEISRSIDCLQESKGVIAGLNDRRESLLSVLGDSYSKIMAAAEKAEDLKLEVDKNAITIADIITIWEALQVLLGIMKEVTVLLNTEMKTKEQSIGSVLPSEDYVWDKNTALQQQMDSAMDLFLNPSKYGFSRVLADLPKAVSYLTESASTITRYNDQKEFFLNYPVAETAIEESFKHKQSVSAHDLPFEPKLAEAYLRLFHSQRSREYSFDNQRTTLVHTKK